MSIRPFHRQRPLVSVALAYGLGVGAGVLFAWRPGLYLLGFAASVVIAGMVYPSDKHKVFGFMACFLFLGILWSGWRSHPLLPQEGKYRVSGILCGDVNLRENGTAAGYLENCRLTDENGTNTIGKLYWTYTPEPEDSFLPSEGDLVSFDARLYHPQGQVNPYGFDYRMYLLTNGIQATVSGARESEILEHPGRGLSSHLYHAKQWLTERLRQIFGEDSALPEALLLGQRDHLPEDTRRSFSDVGVAHLLAVSGLHVSFLAGMLVLPLRRRCSPKVRVYILGGFLLVYCALLDFSAPVVRASVLMMLAAWRRVVRRAPDPLTTLSAAFLLILLVRPLDLFSASFQLSFCAVLGIVVFADFFPRRTKQFFLNRTLFAWRVTVSGTLGVALPVIQIFHRFSLLGLLLNPIACAVFAVLLPTYFFTMLAGCVWLDAGTLLARLVNPVTRGLTSAVAWLGCLPFASVRVPSLPWYCVLAVALALAFSSRYLVLSPKIKLFTAMIALIVSFGAWRLTICRNVQYIQLAMGQADAAILADGKETVVIDAGEYGGDVASYLLATGRNADHLILTHLHTDHCLGVRELLDEEIHIGTVYLPEGAEAMAADEDCLLLLDALREKGIPIQSLAAGDTIPLPRCVLSAVWPVSGTTVPGMDANRYSLCLLCDLDGIRLLTCADLPGDYEAYAARDADILKVPHHGSKSSTSQEFLNTVSPSAALLTASRTSDRLPNPDTLKRLADAGAAVYHTGHTGAVILTAKDGQAVITTFLKENNHEPQ